MPGWSDSPFLRSSRQDAAVNYARRVGDFAWSLEIHRAYLDRLFLTRVHFGVRALGPASSQTSSWGATERLPVSVSLELFAPSRRSEVGVRGSPAAAAASTLSGGPI